MITALKFIAWEMLTDLPINIVVTHFCPCKISAMPLQEQLNFDSTAFLFYLTDLLLCIFRNIQHREEGQAVEKLSPTDAQARKD